MSGLTDSFREVRVFNSHDFYGKGRVYLSYTPNDYGRGGGTAKWTVHRPGFKTDPDAAWYDYGNKTFGLWGNGATHPERKANALLQAQQWADQKYGITEWARDPYGSWGEASFVKTRTAELKNAVKSRKPLTQ